MSGHGVTFGEASRAFARIGLNSFGGPAGQIAVMHRVLVEEKRWVGEERFLHALNYCMLLPGPEAMQLVTYLGWLLHGVPGGLVAGALFVLPGYLSILALSYLYAAFHQVAVVGAALFGLKAAVLAVVLEAVVRISKRVLKNRVMGAIAAAAFVALFVFHVPFPAVVFTAGLVGLVGGRVRPDLFVVVRPPEAKAGAAPVDALLDGVLPAHAQPSVGRAVRTAATWLVLWLGPVGALALALGPEHVFSQIAVFFSQVAVVTFGGAYAVLAYIAQEAVAEYHWLQPPEMLDGLGLAETTPGPLIMVVEFVGFLAAYRNPGSLPPALAGFLGATLTTWVTFAPCFLWIFVGAPWVESLRRRPALSAALSAITAAVVGVVANLAVWFGVHVLFAASRSVAVGPLTWDVPVLASVQPLAVAVTLAAALALLRFHVGMIPVLAASAGVGLLAGLLGWA